MPELSFVTLDVFTTTCFAGNPLAVVLLPPNGYNVSTVQMQALAREFNLSETVFLAEGKASDQDGVMEWTVRIFMTDAELPFAGHPTIGSACYALGTLAGGERKGRLLCKAGDIEVEYRDGVAKASIPHNVHVHTQAEFSKEDVYALQPALRGQDLGAVDVVSPVKGMNFVCVALPSLESLGLVQTSGNKPRPKLDREWDTGFAGSYFYVVIDESPGEPAQSLHLRTRMIEGTLEDPATGSAACGLSALLALKRKAERLSCRITQGVEMGRQSDIGVTVVLKDALGAIERIELSGSSVQVMSGGVSYE